MRPETSHCLKVTEAVEAVLGSSQRWLLRAAAVAPLCCAERKSSGASPAWVSQLRTVRMKPSAPEILYSGISRVETQRD